MKSALKLAFVLGVAALSVSAQVAARPVAAVPAGPAFLSIGPLAFGPDGTLFAGDRDAAMIYAVNLGAEAAGASQGTADVTGLDQKIAAVLGTAAAEVSITDLAVHPTSRNSFISVMRGQGTAAKPALLRVDGAGTIAIVDLAKTTATSVTLPNPPVANAAGRSNPRTQTIMDMALVNGRLVVAGLSNEEFASKLRSIPYPFKGVDITFAAGVQYPNLPEIGVFA